MTPGKQRAGSGVAGDTMHVVVGTQQGTLRPVWKPAARTCVMVSVSYRSHRVSNFHSSRSTATKNCLMPCSTISQAVSC